MNWRGKFCPFSVPYTLHIPCKHYNFQNDDALRCFGLWLYLSWFILSSGAFYICLWSNFTEQSSYKFWAISEGLQQKMCFLLLTQTFWEECAIICAPFPFCTGSTLILHDCIGWKGVAVFAGEWAKLFSGVLLAPHSTILEMSEACALWISNNTHTVLNILNIG